MTTFSTLPTIFVCQSRVVSSSFSDFHSFLFFQLKLLNVFNQHFLNFQLSLLILLFHFFHLLFEIFRFLLIEFSNFFLRNHTAVNRKSFLLGNNNINCVVISLENAILFFNKRFLKLFLNFSNLIRNDVELLTKLTWTPILILSYSLFSLIFTEIKHFLDLYDDLISAIIAHYNGEHLSFFFITKVVAAMSNSLLIYSLNFFHLLF